MKGIFNIFICLYRIFFHGFYELMSIEILHVEISAADVAGRKYCLMVIRNPVTNATYGIVSDPVSDNNKNTVANAKQKWDGGYLFKTFKLAEDGSSFLARYGKERDRNSFQEGDQVEIQNEALEYWIKDYSDFHIQNVHTGEMRRFAGSPRKQRPCVAERTLAISWGLRR